MTLIVSIVTNEFVIQVGDTRVVVPQPSGQFVVQDDALNKLTWFDGRIVLGYSGLSRLAGMRTDQWIASELSHRKFDSEAAALCHLKVRVETELRRLSFPPKYKRLTIVGVGWCRDSQTHAEYPAIWELSNFQSPDGKILRVAEDVFTLSTCTPRPNERFRLYLTGWQPPKDLITRTKQQLKRAIRKHQSPEKLLAFVVDFVRACADITEVVGKNLVSVYVPVNSEPTAIRMTAGQPFSMSMVTTDSTGKPISMMIGGGLAKAATFHSWNAGSKTPLLVGPNVATPQAANIMSALAQSLGPLAQASFLRPTKSPHDQPSLRCEIVPASRAARRGEGLSVHCDLTGLQAGVEPTLGQYELVFLWSAQELEFRDMTFGVDLGGEASTERSYHLLEPGEFNPDDPEKAAVIFKERSLMASKQLVAIQPARLRLATIKFRSLTDGPIWLGGGFPKRDQSLLNATNGSPLNASVSVIWVNK